MISHDKIKEIVLTWEADIAQASVFPRACDNLADEHFSKPVPLVLHGIRRAGKTYLMYRLFREHPGSMYINFEDERLTGHGSDLLEEVYSVYIGIKSPVKPVMFLDEVQNIKGWEKFVARLHSKVKFVVSGSNASLMESDYATALTGRYIPLRVFPMSFSEVLISKGIEKPQLFHTESRAKLRALLSDYVLFGGFPEASLKQDKYLLKAYFESILYRDVIPRSNLQNPAGMEALARYLVSNPGKPFSFRNLIPVSNVRHEDTVKSYVNHLEKAYLVDVVSRFDFSLRKQMVNQKKCYPADTSLTKYSGTLFSEERGRLIETIVYNELKRKGRDIFYWKNERGKEVDFVVCDGLKPELLIQVCEQIGNEKVMKRETDSLLLAREELNVNKLLLITDTIPAIRPPEGIRMIPLLDWLLEE